MSSYPNTIARSANRKFGEWVSVADFGVQGDNTTNDAANINLAISTALANGIGVLVFPSCAGYFVGTTTVQIASGASKLKLIFQPGAVIRYTGAAAALQVGDASADTSQIDLLDPQVDISGAGTGAAGIRLDRCFSVHVMRPRISTTAAESATSQMGIVVNGSGNFCAYVEIENASIRGSYAEAIKLTGTSSLHGCVSCQVRGGSAIWQGTGGGISATAIGVDLDYGDSNVVRDIDCENHNYAYRVNAFDNCLECARSESNNAYAQITATGTFCRVIGAQSSDPAMSVDAAAQPSLQIISSFIANANFTQLVGQVNLYSNLTVEGNLAVLWPNPGASSGPLWQDGSGNLIGSISQTATGDLTINSYLPAGGSARHIILEPLNSIGSIYLRNAGNICARQGNGSFFVYNALVAQNESTGAYQEVIAGGFNCAGNAGLSTVITAGAFSTLTFTAAF